MTARASDVGLPGKPRRLDSLDFLRGLALTMVLVDHIDDLFPQHDFFTRWTLKGLGFSDAAEAFVFLAGFTFGWVYAPRIDRDGFWKCQRKALLRAVTIDVAMLVTTMIVAALAWSVSRSPLAFRLPLTVTSPAIFREAIWDTATFAEPVWGVSILVVYVCVLPFLPAALLIARHSAVSALALSGALYAGTQLIPRLNLGDAGFNPLAWQVLMVIGAVSGQLAVTRGAARRIPPLLIAAAALVLTAGLVVLHGTALPPLASSSDWLRQAVLHSSAFSKTNLGVGRVIHFAAVAIMTCAVVIHWPGAASARWARPFAQSGRHSLPLFCLGVVLAYLAALASHFLPSHVGSLLFLAADAVVIQFVIARLLDARRRATSGTSTGRDWAQNAVGAQPSASSHGAK